MKTANTSDEMVALMKIHFPKTPELKCVTQPTCAPYYAWERDYGAIKSGGGPDAGTR